MCVTLPVCCWVPADAKPSEAKSLPEAIKFMAETAASSPAVHKDFDASRWRNTVLWTENVRAGRWSAALLPRRCGAGAFSENGMDWLSWGAQVDLLYRAHLSKLVEVYRTFSGRFPCFLGATKLRTWPHGPVPNVSRACFSSVVCVEEVSSVAVCARSHARVQCCSVTCFVSVCVRMVSPHV